MRFLIRTTLYFLERIGAYIAHVYLYNAGKVDCSYNY